MVIEFRFFSPRLKEEHGQFIFTYIAHMRNLKHAGTMVIEFRFFPTRLRDEHGQFIFAHIVVL